ncbi:glutathionylspermidine synthase family protein [Granulicella pectinivorans]|nr:glutathionylspermidine synthase family protein [Granulicella pectinivorans]
MKRITLSPRPDWQSKVEAVGLTYHSPESMPHPYWDESAAYEFTSGEIDTLEAAGNTMQEMCLAAAQHVIDNKRYTELDIPAAAIPVIERAWEQEPPAIYGRFDFSWAGEKSGQAPKLLEYNADTPTSLLEAAVVQWDWLKEQTPHLHHSAFLGGDPDQFNSIHEKLIAKWKDLIPYLQQPLYFAGVDEPEDQLTLVYLRDTAEQAGLKTLQMFMEEIGWNEDAKAFLDPAEDQMFSIFKLYPWEAMVREEFGVHALDTYPQMRWIEPIWKMLLSNKGILPILWELYPNHELLLPAFFEPEATGPVTSEWTQVNDGGFGRGHNSAPIPSSLSKLASGPFGMRDYVSKPLLSREGANIKIVRNGSTVMETDGMYDGPRIVQALAPDAVFQAADNQMRYPVLGVWMVDQECCGMGIRESRTPVTDNLSSFIPHYFV